MTDSWRTSRTRQAQQRQRAEVKADREMHETGPWGEGGSLRRPEWMQGIPAMPDTWPVEFFWMQVGKMTLGVYR